MRFSVPKLWVLNLADPVTDLPLNLAGTLLVFWQSPNFDDEIYVRFNQQDEPAFPLQRGAGIETEFDRVFVTVPAGLTGLAYLAYGDSREGRLAYLPTQQTGGEVMEAVRDELRGDVAGEADGAAVVGVAAAAAVAANADRRSLHIQAGLGNTAVITIGIDNTITPAGGVQLAAGMAFWVTDYRGPIWAISTAAGQRLNIFEV